MTLLAILAGIGLALTLGLMPGLHLGLLLALTASAAWQLGVPSPVVAAFLAAAAGVGLYTKRLSLVYHPAAGADNLASLDPAMRLALSGRGREAVTIGVFATDYACFAMLALLALMGLAGLCGLSLLDGIKAFLQPLALAFLLLWLAVTWFHARRKGATVLYLVLAGLFGYLVLHHPGLRGNAHQLAPILTGFFAWPAALLLLQPRVPAASPSTAGVEINVQLVPLGLGLGALTGFLAGLGAGSLASLVQDQAQGDGDYLLLASCAEAMNDWMAFLLVLSLGLGRSGEAVALGQFIQPGQLPVMLSSLLVLAACAYIARQWVLSIQDHYARWVQATPRSVWLALIIGFSFWQLALTGQFLLALLLTLSGFCLAVTAREARVPQQVAFATLVLPLLVQTAGLVPTLNSWLF